MRWERWRVPVMLAPTLTVILLLFGGGLLYAVQRSLGWNPRIGRTTLSLDAYRNLLLSDQYAEAFWRGLALSLWISLASTVLAAVLAVIVALLIRRTMWGRRFSTFLFQFNLPIPHIVAAIGILFLLSPGGLAARVAAQLGVIDQAAQFPILVRDPYGIGIIVAYVWKELPFIGVIVLAVLQALGESYDDVARSLGAGAWQRVRYVTLPLIAPALISASIIVFAFTFGAYEVPAILGIRFPQTLPVLSLRFFLDADLNARAEAMALSVIITVIVLLLVAAYMVAARRAER